MGAFVCLHNLAQLIALRTGLQDKEAQLSSELSAARAGVDAALLDSINLAGAMDALFELVRCANRYMDEREASAAADPGRLTLPLCSRAVLKVSAKQISVQWVQLWLPHMH